MKISTVFKKEAIGGVDQNFVERCLVDKFVTIQERNSVVEKISTVKERIKKTTKVIEKFEERKEREEGLLNDRIESMEDIVKSAQKKLDEEN